MSRNLRVVWREGMLLSPQHLQQWDRHSQFLMRERFLAVGRFGWGLTQLKINAAALSNGSFEVHAARGVFPDGTPFFCSSSNDEPDATPPPPARAIQGHFDARSDTLEVALGLPLPRPGRTQVGSRLAPGLAGPRYSARQLDLVDDLGGPEIPMEVGEPNLSILFPDDPRDEFEHLPVAQLRRTADGLFVLKDEYVPPCMSIGVSDKLTRDLRAQREAVLIKCRALAAQRSTRGDRADFRDGDLSSFGVLRALNSGLPLMTHLVTQGDVHPEEVYFVWAEVAGELCTFHSTIAADQIPPYDHRNPGAALHRLIMLVKELIPGTEERLFRVGLKFEDRYFTGRFLDSRDALAGNRFFLEAAAEMPDHELLRRLDGQMVIAARDQINNLLAFALPGLRVKSAMEKLPAAVSRRDNRAYFELETSSELWNGIQGSQNIAVFTPPIPGLSLEIVGLRE